MKKHETLFHSSFPSSPFFSSSFFPFSFESLESNRISFTLSANQQCRDLPGQPDSEDGRECVSTCAIVEGLCIPCNETEYYSVSTHACVVCSDGSEPDSLKTGCTPCAAGSAGTQGVCEVCPAGLTPNGAATFCEYCPPNSVGSLGFCTPCASGQHPSDDQTLCERCPLGWAGTNGFCDPCAPGSVPDDDGYTCLACDDISVSIDAQCVRCEQWFEPNKLNRSGCEPCPFRYISQSEGICQACPPNQVSNLFRNECLDPEGTAFFFDLPYDSIENMEELKRNITLMITTTDLGPSGTNHVAEYEFRELVIHRSSYGFTYTVAYSGPFAHSFMELGLLDKVFNLEFQGQVWPALLQPTQSLQSNGEDLIRASIAAGASSGSSGIRSGASNSPRKGTVAAVFLVVFFVFALVMWASMRRYKDYQDGDFKFAPSSLNGSGFYSQQTPEVKAAVDAATTVITTHVHTSTATTSMNTRNVIQITNLDAIPTNSMFVKSKNLPPDAELHQQQQQQSFDGFEFEIPIVIMDDAADFDCQDSEI